MNHGFRLAYTTDQAHGKLFSENRQGVLYSGDLEAVALRIKNSWIRGSRSGTDAEKSLYSEQYFDANGNFAEIRERYSERSITHLGITLVSSSTIDLETLTSDLKLPFDKTNVRSDGGC